MILKKILGERPRHPERPLDPLVLNKVSPGWGYQKHPAPTYIQLSEIAKSGSRWEYQLNGSGFGGSARHARVFQMSSLPHVLELGALNKYVRLPLGLCVGALNKLILDSHTDGHFCISFCLL